MKTGAMTTIVILVSAMMLVAALAICADGPKRVTSLELLDDGRIRIYSAKHKKTIILRCIPVEVIPDEEVINDGKE